MAKATPRPITWFFVDEFDYDYWMHYLDKQCIRRVGIALQDLQLHPDGEDLRTRVIDLLLMARLLREEAAFFASRKVRLPQ